MCHMGMTPDPMYHFIDLEMPVKLSYFCLFMLCIQLQETGSAVAP